MNTFKFTGAYHEQGGTTFALLFTTCINHAIFLKFL